MLDPNKTLLIVEDELALQESLAEQMSDLQCTVLRARDGNEGFQLSMTHKPNLILLDIMLPNMDGIEMLAMVRKTDWGRNIPVIVLSNVDPGDETTKRINELGVAYYFIKSNVTPEKLKSTVYEVITQNLH